MARGTADAFCEGMPLLLARDLMKTDPIAVSPETPLLHVHRLFVEEEINGAPVVDEDGRVLGIISSLDLLRAVIDDPDDRLPDVTALDAAVREIVWVRPDTPIPEVARIMRDQRIHRVLVAEDGQLLGILTTFDLLQLVEVGDAAAAPDHGRLVH